MRILGVIYLLLVTGSTLWAEEATVTLRATVTGNQEQPRVMYILPWQQPDDILAGYRLQMGLGHNLFRPVYRDEFVRDLHYRQVVSNSGIDSTVKAKNTTSE